MRRALLMCLACLAAMLFAAPAYAADGDYGIDELSTQIYVETTGAAHIVEHQVITFDNRNEGMVWYLHAPESGESVRIASVRTAPADKGGTLLADWTRLQMIDSNPRLQGAAPGDTAAAALRAVDVQPWYSYRLGDGMMRCYFPTGVDAVRSALWRDGGSSSAATSQSQETQRPEDDEASGYRTYVVETDYTISHRVRVYRDVAELYWRYANVSLPSDSYDVNLQIHLPVPEWADYETLAQSVRAWGHGPNEGVFAVGDDGSVTYHIDHIDKGNYAEAHIIFPAEWLTDVTSNMANCFASVRGPSAIAEEEAWVDKSQREATWDNNVRVLFLAVAVVIILAGLVGVLRYGRSPRSRRVLMRVAVTLALVGLGEQLFFREPLTTAMLMALAVVVGAVCFMLPLREEAEGEEGPYEDEKLAVADGAQGASGGEELSSGATFGQSDGEAHGREN